MKFLIDGQFLDRRIVFITLLPVDDFENVKIKCLSTKISNILSISVGIFSMAPPCEVSYSY